MCGNCREPTSKNTCIDNLENTLNSISESLKAGYNCARDDILLEFDSQYRKLKLRENDIVRDLDAKYYRRLFQIERYCIYSNALCQDSWVCWSMLEVATHANAGN